MILRTVPVSPKPEKTAPRAVSAGRLPSPSETGSPAPAAPPAAAAPEGKGRVTIRAAATSSQLGIGEILTVEVVAETDSGVVDAPFHLLFDPAVFQFVNALQGEFLSQDGSPAIFIANGQARPGDVAVGIGRADRARGVAGSGVLARIRLMAVAPGETTLRFDRAMAWDSGGSRMEIVTLDLQVSVR